MGNKVVVIGQGYVGLTLAIRAVEAGFDVIGLDTDQEKTASLSTGKSHIEDVSDDQVQSAIAAGRYVATSDFNLLAKFDVAVLAVPTPLVKGVPEMRFIQEACETVSRHLTREATVILESTSYPGTTEDFIAPLLEAGSDLICGVDFYLGYSPERIDPGNITWKLRDIPKLVSGVNGESLARVEKFYSRIVRNVVRVSRPREAELAKLLENTFRHVNIALVNEFAIVANNLGIDIWEAVDAASTKPFGFMRFRPGPGAGGHCLPIDPSYLSWHVRCSLGQAFRFIELANELNNRMPSYIVERLALSLNQHSRSVRGSRVLLVGLSYKSNIGDIRESSAIAVAHRLLDLGADIATVDPHVTDESVPTGVARVDLLPEEVAGADAVIILVDHSAIDFELVSLHAKYVLDCCNCVLGDNVERL